MATSPSITTPQPPSLQLPLSEGLTPDSIDTLPVLSALLSRLQNPSQTTTTTTAAASTSGSPPGPAAAGTPSQLASGTGPLTLKDIPTATDELKHKIQRARVQVREMPDMERSIAEQEEEIRELEGRIARQREVLVQLRDIGVAAKVEREEREREKRA